MTPGITPAAGHPVVPEAPARRGAGPNEEVRGEPFRWTAVALLVANAAIHGYLAPMHLAEVVYLGWAFIALVVASFATAVGLAVADRAWLWAIAGVVTALALAGLLASRTIGLPELHDEIGNWADTLAVATLVIEVAIVMFAAARIFWRHTDRRHEHAESLERERG